MKRTNAKTTAAKSNAGHIVRSYVQQRQSIVRETASRVSLACMGSIRRLRHGSQPDCCKKAFIVPPYRLEGLIDVRTVVARMSLRSGRERDLVRADRLASETGTAVSGCAALS